MPSEETLVTIGTIIKPHGIKGELIVKNESRWYEPFKNLWRISAFKGTRVVDLIIEFKRPFKDGLLIKFENFNDPETCEELRGSELRIPAKLLPQLAEDEYYAFELIGFEVFDLDNRLIGNVTDALNLPANDVVIIKGSDEKEWLVPTLKSVIKQIDKRGCKIIMDTTTALSE